MYQAWFRLTQRPFSAVPQPDEYFPTAATAAAYQTICRCVQRGEGTAVVIGPSGTGKTLLSQMLAREFTDTFRMVMINRGPWVTRRGLLQAIQHELGQPFRGLDEGELRLALVDYLLKAEACPNGILLLVDDAHQFPVRVLDELRVLTNVAVKGQPRVRLVLIGASVLEERLASPKLDSFAQRIVARCYLESFTRCETTEYIHDQLRRAGGSETMIPDDVCENIHRATDGVPRLINQLCDHALLLAYANEKRQITVKCVEEAWADLQQLPTPWNSEKTTQTMQGDTIEFGCLESNDTPAPSEMLPSAITPLLRVASDSEFGEFETEMPLEPAKQIEQIESALAASLDDDFQPLASIGPEIEIVSSEPGNPFSEYFEETEEVANHYVEEPAIEKPAVAMVEPPVTEELVTKICHCERSDAIHTNQPELQDAHSEPEPLPKNPESKFDSEFDRIRALCSGNATPSFSPFNAIFRAEEVGAGSAHPNELPVVEETEEEAIAEEEMVEPEQKIAIEFRPAAEIRPMLAPRYAQNHCQPEMFSRGIKAQNKTPCNDSDMIRIEDDYDEILSSNMRPATPVPHQEYRRLFARLRHG